MENFRKISHAICDIKYGFGQTVVEKKSNKIVDITRLLEDINIKKCVVTIDALGTQTKIAEQIKKQRGDYD